MKDMLDKIIQIEKKYIELGETLSDPNVIADYNNFRDLSKQRKSMEETVELYYAWKKAVDAIEDAKQMMHEEKDEEMKSEVTKTLLLQCRGDNSSYEHTGSIAIPKKNMRSFFKRLGKKFRHHYRVITALEKSTFEICIT